MPSTLFPVLHVACILTGKFSHENGFTDNASTFNGDQQTFPKLLQQAGYQTAIIGKWHLISEPQGFDHWSILSGQHEQGDYYDPDFWEDGKHIVEKGYATDIITDKAIKFLENRDKNKPFCMMYHQKAPHRNWMPAPRHLGIFNNTTFPEPANLFDDYEGRGKAAREQDMSIEHTLTNDWDLKLLTREEMLKDTTNRLYSVYKRMPADVQDKWDSVYAQRITEYRKGNLKGKSLISWKYQQYMRDYLATVLSVDENIGRLLNYLEELDKKGIRFALSNVLESKGKKNVILSEWINQNKKFKAIPLNYDYTNSNYHTKKDGITKEVLVVNY